MRSHAAISRWALALGLALGPALAQAQQHDHTHGGTPPPPAALGTLHFPVSCTPEAQAAFDDAMKLQHSFWYQAADQAHRRVLERDPSCAMGYWGQALALLRNPFSPPPPNALPQGRALLEQAQRIGAKTEREAGFISALTFLFAGDDMPGHRARVVQYAQAMEALSGRLPDDPEVAITHALSLVMAASPTDKTYANQLRAGDILEREYTRYPQHPGISHYLIHAYDVPALAHKGIAAAERYAALAADAPHALHMPSHIFTRVGRWDDSIETNRRSAETARAREEVFDELHALDYMVYGYLQTGRSEAARRVLDEVARYAAWTPPTAIGGYALTAMPARLALEYGDWETAARLGTRRYDVPFVDATTHFARAVGAARAGRPEAAAADVEALRAAAAALQGRDAYWQEQVEILRVAAEGWVVFTRGERDAGLALLREAADREGRTEKHPVTPGPLFPAREQLAEMLLMTNRHAEARREFEAVQQTEPNRFRAVYGAGRAAELAGDRDEARRHYQRLVQLAERADAPRPEIEQARAFVNQR
ncbi:bacterial transcriptional activator domain-containing protein [Belnapia sp. T18]|uniref:Bacterial transcriptional activator domain-containing protein n=1 Tax=Belnapia arida TaxID=2804533 RepID=A0ABS1UA68_9PROT|nr:bacterial transcriptional activator domain-containing protein [Belnapia arida]MBL6081561.1 bacterial transcriptional activator domain-containing protein [Belnapia arida]